MVPGRVAAPQSSCVASGSSYKFEEGRGFLLGNGEEAERSALRPAQPLLPASNARHASSEVARKIGLAQAKRRANLANLFWSQGGHIRRNARHSHARGLPAAVLCGLRESSHHLCKKRIFHLCAPLKPQIACFSVFFCSLVKSACSFLLKIMSRKTWPSCSM